MWLASRLPAQCTGFGLWLTPVHWVWNHIAGQAQTSTAPSCQHPVMKMYWFSFHTSWNGFKLSTCTCQNTKYAYIWAYTMPICTLHLKPNRSSMWPLSLYWHHMLQPKPDTDITMLIYVCMYSPLTADDRKWCQNIFLRLQIKYSSCKRTVFETWSVTPDHHEPNADVIYYIFGVYCFQK